MIGIVRIVALVIGSAALLCGAGPLHAQCSSPQHHQFDFVIGNWLVRDSSGHAIGTTTVTSEYGGCVLIEKWRGVANSGEGLGVAGYQPARGTWHRDFIAESGFVLAIDGQLEGTVMVMTGKDYTPDGARLHRVTWTRRSDGSVVERWQISTDAGRSWQMRFYGVFERIAE